MISSCARTAGKGLHLHLDPEANQQLVTTPCCFLVLGDKTLNVTWVLSWGCTVSIEADYKMKTNTILFILFVPPRNITVRPVSGILI